MKSPLVAVALAFLASALSAQHTGYQQVLVPFDTASIPGLFGTTWSAELWVHNSSDQPINLFPETCYSFGQPVPCFRRVEIAGKSTQMLQVGVGSSAEWPGVFLYIPEDRVQEVHFHQRIRNLSSVAHSSETEIPILREQEYPTGMTQLLNVPLDRRFRLKLRLYLADAVHPTFVIRVYDMGSDHTKLAEQQFHEDSLFPPDYGQPIFVPRTLDYTAILAQALGRAAAVRVEIEPIRPREVRYWPLLTVTNNETQLVTIITPQ